MPPTSNQSWCNVWSLYTNKYWSTTSSTVGAATRMIRQRLLMAGITLLVELQHSMSLHVLMYFSIVRLRACWAFFVSLSTSVNTTTTQDNHHNTNAVVMISWLDIHYLYNKLKDFLLIMYSKFVWPNLIWLENVWWLAIIISPVMYSL